MFSCMHSYQLAFYYPITFCLWCLTYSRVISSIAISKFLHIGQGLNASGVLGPWFTWLNEEMTKRSFLVHWLLDLWHPNYNYYHKDNSSCWRYWAKLGSLAIFSYCGWSLIFWDPHSVMVHNHVGWWSTMICTKMNTWL